MRSRKRLIFTSSFLSIVLASGIAGAQRAMPRAPRRPSSNSEFSLRRGDTGAGSAALARQRARAGDCAGALGPFDTAVRQNIDPTLRRDRGLCHEKLSDPYPAIDDFRVYLAARPDAADAEQIREHLTRLEESVGPRSSPGESDDSVSAGGSFSLGTADEGTRAARSSNRASATLGPRPGERERSYDYYASEERLAEASDTSPLRFGRGWELGPFMMLPRFFVGTNGVSKSAGYGVGASIRYSFSPTLTLVTELGYAGLGTSGAASSVGGPLLFAGLEARIPLDRWASNHFLLGVGPGFESYTASGSKASLRLFEARARVGFRHVFGPSVGLEFLVDGGPVYAKVDGFDGSMGGVVGGSVGLIVGF
jgi:hypothetical protein